MQAWKVHVLIVYGYGTELNDKLKKYLLKVVRYITLNRPTHIVLCGGHTQQKSSDLSEAEVMLEFINATIERQSILPCTYKPEFFLEEESYTTLDNTIGATRIIKANIFSEEPNPYIVAFCEVTRGLKIDIQTRHFLGRRVDIQTDSWEERNPLLELLSTFLEWLAIYIRPMASYARWNRKRKAKNR